MTVFTRALYTLIITLSYSVHIAMLSMRPTSGPSMANNLTIPFGVSQQFQDGLSTAQVITRPIVDDTFCVGCPEGAPPSPAPFPLMASHQARFSV